MINKKIDSVILGNNLLSYIMAIKNIKNERSCIVLDDIKMKFGSLYIEAISDFEKNMLELLGRTLNIDSLKEISNYLSERHITFVIDNTMIRLGRSPYRNLVELARKFPNLFFNQDNNGTDLLNLLQDNKLSEEFDFRFNQFLKATSKMTMEDGFKLNQLLTICPKIIKDLFEGCLRFFNNKGNLNQQLEKYWEHKTLFYMARGYYQNKLGLKMSQEEVFHLFLSMLSPLYDINHELLINDLKNYFLNLGGQFKISTVSEMIFDEKKPWAMQLTSYEGVIRPGEILFVGGWNDSMTLCMTPQFQYYDSYLITFSNIKNIIPSSPQRYLFSSQEKLGTNQPMWELTVDKNISCKAFISHSRGEKKDFVENEYKKQIIKEINNLLPIIDDFQDNSIFTKDDDILTNDDEVDRLNFKKSNITLQDSFNGNNTYLKNVFYCGPNSNAKFGLLSSLININSGYYSAIE